MAWPTVLPKVRNFESVCSAQRDDLQLHSSYLHTNFFPCVNPALQRVPRISLLYYLHKCTNFLYDIRRRHRQLNNHLVPRLVQDTLKRTVAKFKNAVVVDVYVTIPSLFYFTNDCHSVSWVIHKHSNNFIYFIDPRWGDKCANGSEIYKANDGRVLCYHIRSVPDFNLYFQDNVRPSLHKLEVYVLCDNNSLHLLLSIVDVQIC